LSSLVSIVWIKKAVIITAVAGREHGALATLTQSLLAADFGGDGWSRTDAGPYRAS